MIEVIYDKNKENEAKVDAGEGVREKKSDAGFSLPKNIRQIGTPPSNKRIYIEDYVVTYLNYISRPGSTSARGAILLGECKRTDIGDIIFISGAVEAENLEFDMDESEFTQDAWSKIYEQLKEFFPDLSVVGWFLSRMGFSTAINDKIEKMHVENFPGKDKVLYVTDSLENEDAFYMYEKGQLVKQKGYYIYYVKNEQMQNYIVKKRGGMPEEANTEIRRKDEELIRTYREKNPERKPAAPRQSINLFYVAGSFLVLGMLVMGVALVSNSDKMREMEVSLSRLELTADGSSNDNVVDAMADADDKTTEETMTASDADKKNEGKDDEKPSDKADTEKDDTGNIKPDDKDKTDVADGNVDGEKGDSTPSDKNDGDDETSISTEQTLPTSTGGNPTYYKIEYGDSLGSISLKYYGSVIYAEDIAEANNMDVDDKIYEGENIIIPSIKVKEE